MTAPELAAALATPGEGQFRKSSFCANDSCVEVAIARDEILVRDGKNRQAPLLHFSPTAWATFLTAVSTGDLVRSTQD